MAGGNHHGKPSSHSHHNKPPSTSSSHRKSRWETDRKSSGGDLPKPPPKPSPNQTRKSSKPNPPTPQKSSNNPLPVPSPAHHKLPHNPSGSSAHPVPHPPPFPDLPTYGFHMLDRRTIVLADGTVRSYFALPLDYQDFAPPVDQLQGRFFPGPELGMSPGGMRPDLYGRNRNQEQWNVGGEGSLKRKFGGGEEGKDEMLRKRQQVLNYGNANSSSSNMYSLGGSNNNVNSSGAFSREEESRPSSKYMRMGGAGGYNPSLSQQSSGGGQVMGTKHGSVNQDALKKAFLRFAKLINENPSKRKKYMEEGREGSLQCVVCGRFDIQTGILLFVTIDLLAFICFCLKRNSYGVLGINSLMPHFCIRY